MYGVFFSKQAQKDLIKLKSAGLSSKAKILIEVISDNPFQTPPFFEKLMGNLDGFYSRRINIQHRLIYSVDTDTKTVKILRMWTHYE